MAEVVVNGNVAFERPDYLFLRKQWIMIEDCLNGEMAVKLKSTEYLPKPNPIDTSDENAQRYIDYIQRAVFYNVTRRTIAGLVGLVHQRDPEIKLPSKIAGLEFNADGAGVNLVQISKKCLWNAVSYGRTGILVDYPHADKPMSIAEVARLGIQPTLTVYHPKNIINWKTAVVGGKRVYTLIVLSETEFVEVNEFEMRDRRQYRVLRLVNGVYQQQLFKNEGTEPQEVVEPRNANGQIYDRIPFFPIGAESNDLEAVAPPAYDLATINIAHYRNSADYEEACFITGQPTLILSGLTETWIKAVFGDKAVQLGSRSAVALNEGATANMLQAEPNTMLKEAMDAKEQQMIALGARLVQNSKVQRTATEATQDQTNADSVLANCAKNVQDAIIEALQFAGGFVNTESESVEFKLNTEFDLTKLSPEDVKQVIAAWQSNAITTSEMRHTLARAGIATLNIDEYNKEISEDVSLAAENANIMMEATTPVQPANGVP